MDVAFFLEDHNTRLTWIAFFTQWVLWGVVYTLRHVFGESEKTATDTDAEGEGEKKRIWKPSGSFATRISNAHRVLEENTLLLLSVLVLNTFGRGSTRAVMILTWIFFAFTAVVAFSETAYHHRFLRFVYSTLFFALTLAIGGLAFAQGW